jgi:Xaa-Pro aminopeptidase
MDHELRRAALVARLDDLGVDALFVSRLQNVRYLTGFTGSNGQTLVGKKGTVFFTDGRYTEQARREAPDVERLTCPSGYRAELAERCDGIVRLGFESHEMSVADHDLLGGALGGVELLPVAREVERLRATKDDGELELLRVAQRITDAAFDRLLDVVAVGLTERRLAMELERLLREEGADDMAFDPIVGFGENAAEPHHVPGHRLLEEGDVIKIDMGALAGGYHADMTRTVSFGSPPAELRKIHDVVRQAQEAGIDAVRAGATGIEVDAVARTVIRDAGYGSEFVHGLGHGVGLEIHEEPWLGPDKPNVLPVGAVVTVEPGVYVPGLGGVRIEDMVEVTAEGGRVLGTSTRELIEL